MLFATKVKGKQKKIQVRLSNGYFFDGKVLFVMRHKKKGSHFDFPFFISFSVKI